MKFSKLISKIAPVAQTLAAGLGGPVAGTAVAFIAKTLGVEPNEAAIETAIATDPEALLKLRAEDHRYEEEMAQKGIDVFALQIEDTKDARRLARETSMWPQIILSVLFVSGYFAVVFQLLSGAWALPDGGEGQFLAGLLGIGMAAVKDILQFWFGSSHGSKMKGPK